MILMKVIGQFKQQKTKIANLRTSYGLKKKDNTKVTSRYQYQWWDIRNARGLERLLQFPIFLFVLQITKIEDWTILLLVFLLAIITHFQISDSNVNKKELLCCFLIMKLLLKGGKS